MPSASARRGRWAGRTDSLTSRLITATTASDAGHSISSDSATMPQAVPGPALAGKAAPTAGCSSISSTVPTLPASKVPR